MNKSEQFIPLSEEEREEKDRLQKGDKDHQTFITSEDVADDALLPDQFEEREAMFEDDDIEGLPELFSGDDEFPVDEEFEREQKINKLKKEITQGNPFARKDLEDLQKETKKEPLYFHQGEGVASVGPDVVENEVSLKKESLSNEDIGTGEQSYGKSTHTKSMSPDVTIPFWNSRAGYRRDVSSSEGRRQENLKTQSDSKRQRSLRQKIRNFLSGQKSTEDQQDAA